MRIAERRLLAVALALALAPAASAAAAPHLEVLVPPQPLTVGDRLRVEVRGHGAGLAWDELAVGTARDEQTWAVVQPPQALAPGRWELVLAPLATGELALPELAATARDGDGRPMVVPAAKAPAVAVASVLPQGEEAPAPAPPAPPIGAPGFPWEWALPVLLVLLPPAALAAWWARRRRGGADAAPPAAVAPLTELEQLLQELERELERAPAGVVCDRLAHGLRRYVERRTAEPAGEMTTAELRTLVRRRGWPEPVYRGIAQALGTADAVRFARRPTLTSSLRVALEQAAAAAAALEITLAPPGESP